MTASWSVTEITIFNFTYKQIKVSQWPAGGAGTFELKSKPINQDFEEAIKIDIRTKKEKKQKNNYTLDSFTDVVKHTP